MVDKLKQASFLFYDYETFGKSPVIDRPAQFAAIRTDEDFNILDVYDTIYCRPPSDYLPDPEAVLITGITPQQAMHSGVCEAEFARRIHKLFTEPQTCVVGYNNVRFDDEVTRNLFYRNFLDPYAWSWQNGNTRWDLLDVARACYALRPDGLNWPRKDNLPSFRLEELTKANGLEHLHAHDALSDVHATIALAKQIKEKQPRLFSFLFTHRTKQAVATLIDVTEMKMLIHVSGMFGASRDCTSLIAPLAWHPKNSNALIVCDLTRDIHPLLELDATTLRERLYTKNENLGDNLPIPLKLVHINKCPVLASANVIRCEDARRLKIDLQYCADNHARLQRATDIREKVATLFAEAEDYAVSDNVDAQLYDGFFSHADKVNMEIIQSLNPTALGEIDLFFDDKRIEKLLFRYRARNFEDSLNDDEQNRWCAHRREIFSEERVKRFFDDLASLAAIHQRDERKMRHLKALSDYVHNLVF